MSDKTFAIWVIGLLMTWNMFLIAGAAYLIEYHYWSNWTMLLAIILCKWISNDINK